MLGSIQPATADVVAVGKLLFFGMLAVGAVGYHRLQAAKRWGGVAAAIIAAVILLAAVILRGAATLWHGLAGDELLVTSFYQRVITDGFGHDFTYPNLPPFYPPLWFYLVGGIARFLQLDGVGAAKLGAILAIALVPVVVWLFARRRANQDESVFSSPFFPLLLTVLPFAAVDFPSVLTKPYEFISAIAVLLWFTVVSNAFSPPYEGGVRGGSRWHWRAMLIFGLLGAVLFTTYYLWFVVVAIAVITFAPWQTPRALFAYVRRWLTLGSLVALGAIWYWGPLLTSYWRNGMENWQPAFFILSDFHFFPPIEFTPRSAWLWLGLVSLIAYRRRMLVRPAMQLLAATYVWQIVSFVATLAGQAPFQAARGFTFLGEIILAYGVAYGVAQWFAAAVPADGFAKVTDVLRHRLLGAASGWPAATRFFIVWLAIAVSLPFGLWLDQEATQQNIERIRKLDVAVQLFARHFRMYPEHAALTTLSFFPKLNAYVALPQYISHNQHYSHPAANFSQRQNFLRGQAQAPTPAEFARRFTTDNPAEPIEQFILYTNGDNYELYFWMDDYPNGGREEVIHWPKQLIAEPFFSRIEPLSIGGFAAWRKN